MDECSRSRKLQARMCLLKAGIALNPKAEIPLIIVKASPISGDVKNNLAENEMMGEARFTWPVLWPDEPVRFRRHGKATENPRSSGTHPGFSQTLSALWQPLSGRPANVEFWGPGRRGREA